jgi:hypothetical protein
VSWSNNNVVDVVFESLHTKNIVKELTKEIKGFVATASGNALNGFWGKWWRKGKI